MAKSAKVGSQAALARIPLRKGERVQDREKKKLDFWGGAALGLHGAFPKPHFARLPPTRDLAHSSFQDVKYLGALSERCYATASGG